jgi:hypothetical protein
MGSVVQVLELFVRCRKQLHEQDKEREMVEHRAERCVCVRASVTRVCTSHVCECVRIGSGPPPR